MAAGSADHRPEWTSLEPGAAILAIAALAAMLRFKIGMGWTLAASGLVGALYYVGRGWGFRVEVGYGYLDSRYPNLLGAKYLIDIENNGLT
ncbi:hypothetical protein [Lysobacter sp. CA196]|uniref:hypothetical protein n=1 Tax=Lysobacter sp. CA196 TaxID=3455606 RepID=UPI003F8D65A0